MFASTVNIARNEIFKTGIETENEHFDVTRNKNTRSIKVQLTAQTRQKETKEATTKREAHAKYHKTKEPTTNNTSKHRLIQYYNIFDGIASKRLEETDVCSVLRSSIALCTLNISSTKPKIFSINNTNRLLLLARRPRQEGALNGTVHRGYILLSITTATSTIRSSRLSSNSNNRSYPPIPWQRLPNTIMAGPNEKRNWAIL